MHTTRSFNSTRISNSFCECLNGLVKSISIIEVYEQLELHDWIGNHCLAKMNIPFDVQTEAHFYRYYMYVPNFFGSKLTFDFFDMHWQDNMS